MNRKELGKLGEKYAVDYLKSNNYEIIEINYRCRYGEIDIIAKERNTLVFVEVKTRSSDAFGRGLEAVDLNKRRKIKQVALYFLNNYHRPVGDIRFDVIDINIAPGSTPKLLHLKCAF
ncbi:MAG: YraN family protein [Bacillota bacterium]